MPKVTYARSNSRTYIHTIHGCYPYRYIHVLCRPLLLFPQQPHFFTGNLGLP